MNMVKVEITSRETIKPSSPTPHRLQKFKLSLLDQLSPQEYVPMIFYYATDGNCNVKTTEKINRLKKSLSETLTRFYPLAGRIKENLFIECNDEGVDFFEGKVNCPLSEILRQPEATVLDHFLPHDYHCSKSLMEAQLAIQVNIFSCGGMAIGICILHKIVDGTTFGSFFNGWAAMARGSGQSVSPIYVGSYLFPPRDLSGLMPSLDVPKAKCITKRFVFDGSKIASLRAKVSNSSFLDHPSRFEVVSALIWKCAMDISRSKSSVATQTVNLRPRMDPPMPECCAGNLLWLAIAPSPAKDGQIELPELVGQIRKAIKKFDNHYVRTMQGENGFSVIWETLKQVGELCSNNNIDIYRFTSLGNTRLHEADFGWGKPVWVSSAGLVFKNVILLIETRFGDGIEAWVTLDEQDMPIFERNQELLAVVSSTPTASLLLLHSQL